MNYRMDIPDGWERVEDHCYPRNGSKAYKSDHGLVIMVVNMYDTGTYNVNAADGSDVFDEMVGGYYQALETARQWMVDHSP